MNVVPSQLDDRLAAFMNSLPPGADEQDVAVRAMQAHTPSLLAEKARAERIAYWTTICELVEDPDNLSEAAREIVALAAAQNAIRREEETTP